jgi:hypothetical protein
MAKRDGRNVTAKSRRVILCREREPLTPALRVMEPGSLVAASRAGQAGTLGPANPLYTLTIAWSRYTAATTCFRMQKEGCIGRVSAARGGAVCG